MADQKAVVVDAVEETRKRVVTERLTEARERLRELQKLLVVVDEELKYAIVQRDGRPFPIVNADRVIYFGMSVYNEVARANGAAMVHLAK